VLSKTFGGQNKNFKRPPFRNNFNCGPGFHQKFPKSNKVWKKPTSETPMSTSRPMSYKPLNNFQGRTDKKDFSKVVCYKCHKLGHLANTCKVSVKKVNILSIMGNYKTVDSLLTVAGTVNGVKLL
jgi:hypothetical protein